MSIRISGDNLAKAFVRKNFIFKNVSFSLNEKDILAVTGDNGSGKSTLIKIIAGVLKQSVGEYEIVIDDKQIEPHLFFQYFGFVAPYLNIYEEFTPLEHIEIISRMRSEIYSKKSAEELLLKFNLLEHRNMLIRSFSSGMKQRVKFLLALYHKPRVLILDEPSTNLDYKGIETIRNIIQDFVLLGNAVIIATNDEREKTLCNKTVSVMNINPLEN